MSNTKDAIIAKQAEQIQQMRSIINLMALIHKEFLEALPEDFHDEEMYQRALKLSHALIDQTGGTPNLADIVAEHRRGKLWPPSPSQDDDDE